MKTVGFIGLGHMGRPMAQNLIKAGYELHVYDLSAASVSALVTHGAKGASSAAEAASNSDVIITMLPEGAHVRDVYLGSNSVLSIAKSGALLIDCSTIDVETSRFVHTEADTKGFEMLDAPVSGGVKGAEDGTLTFMVGGRAAAFEQAKPLLEVMGAKVVHVGSAGNGQAVKICNNMVLGISMIGVSEAFNLGEALGLSRQNLFDIMSTSSAQCWSLNSYAPVPDVVPTSPANHNYEPGFSSAMMLKDLKLAEKASKDVAKSSPLGHSACELYENFCNSGGNQKDFSAVIKFLQNL